MSQTHLRERERDRESEREYSAGSVSIFFTLTGLRLALGESNSLQAEKE